MATNNNETNSSMYGKPWSVRSTHTSYADAAVVKEKLLGSKTLQVKIKRLANETFCVKVRSLEPQQSKSQRKKAAKAKRKKEKETKK
jgi:hypothetical protein